MIIYKGYKFRLKTNTEHERLFHLFSGHHRFLWNKSLSLQINRLERKVQVLSYQDLDGLLKLWKKSEEYGFLKEAHSQCEQQALKDLDRALWDGLNRVKGMPKFRKKGQHDSFRYPQGFEIKGNQVYLPKIGWVRFFKSRNIQGIPKNITVSRHGRYWYISIQAKQEISDPTHLSTTAVGIDLGIKRFAVLSDGSFYEPLNSFKKLENKLAKEQRKLSRKKKFSKNWYKQKQKVNKIHIYIADARKDYLHKISTEISKNHAMIVMEDLKVSNMSKSAKGTIENPGKNVKQKSGLNKAILDQGWSMFRSMLEYKQRWVGGRFEVVSPQYTSQICPNCDHVSKENRKTQSEFKCELCNFEGNADHVAAINILRRAGHARIACGDTDPVRELAQEPCAVIRRRMSRSTGILPY